MAGNTQLPVYRNLRQILRRFDSNSVLALGVLVVTMVAVGKVWREHVEENSWMWRDGLLLGTWAVMFVLLAWDIRPRRDVPLALVGFAGGLVIEWWGTTTLLWVYFTEERPPFWILPAWPTAALAIDRLARMATAIPGLAARARGVYWVVLPSFIAAMTWFLWPSIRIPSSWVVLGIMLTTLFARPLHHRDVCLFVAGTALGVLLETWGTTRHCWTYYTEETPPWIAVAAHGFAAVAFSRAVQLLDEIGSALPGRRSEVPR